jgi:methionyl aminopeptidase
MIQLKSPQEIERMRTPARIDAEVLAIVRENCLDGVTTWDLDRIAEEETLRRKGRTTFKGYRGFPGSLCTSINDEVVHGIPSRKRVLKSGDIIGIDFGVTYDGFIGDHAMTVPVGEVSEEIARLLRVTEESLANGIAAACPGNYLVDISRAIQDTVEPHGYGIVREFCGHGIGRALHEDPPVLNYVQNGARGPKLRPGLVLALEPMVNLGTEKVRTLSDGWTVVTMDQRPSAHFEHTVAVTVNGPEVLTRL